MAMLSMEEWKKQVAAERAAADAKALRYKKPMMSILNMSSIQEELEQISEECSNAEYMDMNDREKLVAMFDDEEDVNQFILEFSALNSDCDDMAQDLYEIRSDCNGGSYNENADWECENDYSNWFDDVFTLIGAGVPQFGSMLGFDIQERDYYGLGEVWYEDKAQEGCTKRLMRLTKSDMLCKVATAVKVAMNFAAIQDRYACLKAALDILEAESGGHVKAVQEMDRQYEEGIKTMNWNKFDRICDRLPDECWLY